MASKPNEVDERELTKQMERATEWVQQAVRELLRETDIHPHVIVFAVARVAGELMGALAAASGHSVDEVVKDSTEIVHQAARTHHDELLALKAELMPVAGNA